MASGAGTEHIYVPEGDEPRPACRVAALNVAERVTRRSSVVSFSPHRGLARSLAGRSYTIGTWHSTASRGRTGEGFYQKFEYSHAFGQHWRLTGQAVLLRGSESDFIGQYHRNSFGAIKLRYSF